MAAFGFTGRSDQRVQLGAELNSEDIWGSCLKVVEHGLFLLYFQMQIAEYALGTGRKVHVCLRCVRSQWVLIV